jgi:methylmalonyl-CoA epimerase
MALTGIHHVAYVVADMDEAIRFMEESLGLKLDRRETLEEFEGAFFRVGESIIELIRPRREDSEYTKFLREGNMGLHHVAFSSPDIEEQAERMKEGGVGFERIWVAETDWLITNVDNGNNKLGMRLQLVAEKDKWSEREKRGLDVI